MKKLFFLFYIFCFVNINFAQNACANGFLKDTLTIPKENKLMDGECFETTLKNLSKIQIYKISDGKFYLRMYITKNFYFNKIDVLEIRSGKKSYYAKDTKQFKITKTKGMYVIEVFKNYLNVLKDEGITSLVFAGAETEFTRNDTQNIKEISNCFYEQVFVKK